MSSDSLWKRFCLAALFPCVFSHESLCHALYDQAAMSSRVGVFGPVH